MMTVLAVGIFTSGWLLRGWTARPRLGRPALDDRDLLRRRTLGFWIPRNL